MPTLKDVADLAGVSLSTVAKFFQGKSVKEETRNAIINAKNKLKYRMDFDVGKEKKYNIIVYIGKFYSKSIYILSVLDGIKDGAKQNCMDVTVNIMDTFDISDIYDGVIAIGTDENEGAILTKAYMERNIPLVFVNRQSHDRHINFISVDNYQVGYDAMKYLISMGHRRIAIVKGSESFLSNRERFDACIQVLKESNIELDPKLILEGNNSKSQVHKLVTNILASKGYLAPTAIFAHSDEMAVSVIKAIAEMGFKVPEDISVIGVDDIDIVSYMHPSLTTVRIPSRSIGIMSTEIILNIIMKKEISRQTILVRHEIVKRETVKKL